MKIHAIKLKEVTKKDCQFLYRLLGERDPRSNISHKIMPPYNEHVKFVMSKPYFKWYIIYCNNQKAGTIYLTNQNEVGLFIKNQMQGYGIGKKALNLLMKCNPRKIYLANVSPKNKKSIRFFKNNGFKLIQHTYELSCTLLNNS